MRPETYDDISKAFLSLYNTVDMLTYHELSDLQREFALLDIMIMTRKRTLLDAALLSKNKSEVK